MTTVEVDATQLETLNKAHQLFNSLLEDPKSGLDLKKMIKAKYPTAKVADLDLIEQVTAPYNDRLAAQDAAMTALQARLDAAEQARENEKAETTLVATLDRVKKDYGFTEEGMTKVLETMRDRNLAHDPEAAAALVRAQMPKTAPTSNGNPWMPPKVDIYGLQSATVEDKWKKLHQAPWDFFADEVAAVLSEDAAAA